MTIIYIMVIGVIIFALILIATLVAISKGYSFKHEVDPLPGDERETEKGKE